jgi:hypothetical protein
MRRWPPSSASDCGPWRDAVEASTCAAGRGTRESRSLRVPRSDDHERGNTLISPSPPAQTMSVATGDRLNAGGSPLYFHTTRDATSAILNNTVVLISAKGATKRLGGPDLLFEKLDGSALVVDIARRRRVALEPGGPHLPDDLPIFQGELHNVLSSAAPP